MIEKIISGGQTGVDRAALDFAINRRIPHGGYCPLGRIAEDGSIPTTYRLTELSTADYSARTRKNVEVSDGTLIVHRGDLRGGTAYTAELCRELAKPLYLIDVGLPPDRAAFAAWIDGHGVRTLNVAGPRESQSPGIGLQAQQILRQLMA